MKKIFLAVILLASTCVHADFTGTIMGLANSMVDDPIDTHAKNVVAKVTDINPSDYQDFSFGADVKHVYHAGEVSKSFTCSTVTLEDSTEYRMAIKLMSNGEFVSILEGEPFYLSLCAPHTKQGQLEQGILDMVDKLGELSEALEDVAADIEDTQ